MKALSVKMLYFIIFKRFNPPYNASEIQVIVLNASDEYFLVTRGMRIAQAVLAPVTRAAWAEVEDLDETARGAGGFGSTGH
jgi:dUTP pyrophosphatase